MRISSTINDADYPYHDIRLVREAMVLLDGVPINHCIFADEQRGEVWVSKKIGSDKFNVVDSELIPHIYLGKVEVFDAQTKESK